MHKMRTLAITTGLAALTIVPALAQSPTYDYTAGITAAAPATAVTTNAASLIGVGVAFTAFTWLTHKLFSFMHR